MERRENKRYIAIVRDRSIGSYGYRGVESEKGVMKNVEILKKKGIKEKDIDILPVKDTPKYEKVLMIAGIVCTLIDLGLTIRKAIVERKNKKKSETSGKV